MTLKHGLEARRIFKLAFPIILAQTGQMFVGVADAIFVGRIGANELAAAALSHSIFTIGLVLGIGFSWAMTPLVSAAVGARDKRAAALVLASGTLVNIIVGMIISTALFGVGFLFDFMGQPPIVIQLARPYFLITVASMTPIMIFQSFKQFSDGLHRVKPGMTFTIAGNIVNISLNYLLIWGFWIISPMGLNGSAVASLISRCLMALAASGYFLWSKSYASHREQLRGLIESKSIVAGELRRMAAMGAHLALQSVFEVSAFALGAVMMGWLGTKQLAAHQAAITTASLTYMAMSGIAAAATIRVGALYGARKFKAMEYSANVSMAIAITCMLITASVYILGRNLIPMAYLSDPEALDIAAKLFVIAGIFQIFDGLQVVALGALRGVADVRTPALISAFSYLVLSLPISYLAAFQFGLRETGVWTGYVVGLIASSSLFILRFRIFCKKISYGSSVSRGDDDKFA